MKFTTTNNTLIWESLNKVEGRIDPSEFKNYILGIIFYKFLSEKALDWLARNLPNESLNPDSLQGSNEMTKLMQKDLGYVIQPGDSFMDWVRAIHTDDFNIKMVSNALVNFDQNIGKEARGAFSNIFEDLDLNSSHLGSNSQTRTNTVKSWLKLINEFETNGNLKELGDCFEYLISMFSANAGTRTGEFYTPREVADVMARILTAGHESMKACDLYDPTMGSGSLLLRTAAHMKNASVQEKVTYYGQELNATTYNLARMNLMIHGIEYDDINLRHADTLNGDWPVETTGEGNQPKTFDAVMLNPPYSSKWDNVNREKDPRFKAGVAPKSKADDAFLLHGLYHLKSDGRMAIILPHGVLFRGAMEGQIRKELLENHNIVAVIGLPGKIFNGTGIPTVIIVLEKKRTTDDVLFIDASSEFEKQRNINKLRQKDIDKIIETFITRSNVARYAHVATMDEIRRNEYNLNIPRYVDTFIPAKLVPLDELDAKIAHLDEQLLSLETDSNLIMKKYRQK